MSDSSHNHTNELAKSSSPYLLQHAHNPVDWLPWCDEAFTKAASEEKLIFISIGYSACHWCHVMEGQTFEDEKAAEFLNKNFISIKVDREERPDVDAAYMHAVQIMTGRGGWPLNCIALPDGRPIFGGTYFPKDTFLDRLSSILSLKSTHPSKLEEYATKLQQGVALSDLISAPPLTDLTPGAPWPQSLIDSTSTSLTTQLAQWQSQWDSNTGLSLGAPKFPLPTNLDFLLHFGTTQNDENTLAQARLTLDSMSRGGIYDQLGGGFARYSTDSDWKVPHFEKMLYDNAQLITTYSQAYQIFKDPTYKRVVFQTIEFLLRDLDDPSGGFRSALDADTDGEEGKFYVWTLEELRLVLSESQLDLAVKVYEIDGKSHWEHGKNVLMKWASDEVLANSLDLTQDEFQKQLDELNSTLLKHRSNRTHPGLDDKVLTSWTAQTVTALSTAYRVFRNQDHINRARIALDFILENSEEQLHHTYHPTTGHTIPGFLEDYAFTIKACIDFYEATFELKYLYSARDLVNIAFDKFYDVDHGTFWFTSSDENKLFVRKQENDDSVSPSSNSTMAINLFKLGKFFSQPDWIYRSDRMILSAWDDTRNLRSSTNWAKALLHRIEPFCEIVLAASDENTLYELHEKLDQHYIPQTIVTTSNSGTNIPSWAQGKMTEKDSKIYICTEGACKLPFDRVEDAIKGLNLNL